MTYTYKLSRRLARLRVGPVVPLVLLVACSAGAPTDPSLNPPMDTGTDGPVALSPRSVTLEGSQGALFKAFESLIPGSSQVTSIEWIATGGTIDASGNYASTGTGSFKVVGRRKGNPHNQPDTSVVIVVPTQPTLVKVTLTPSTATVATGTQRQFSVVGTRSDNTQVQIGVTWSADGGTIDQGGLYTAGRPGTYHVVAKHVTTGLADTAVVTVPPATLTSITLAPTSVSLSAGQSLQFSVVGHLSDGTITPDVPVAYSATGGSISVTGFYVAGSSGGTYRVIATAQGGMADTSSVSIVAPSTSGTTLVANFETGNLGQYAVVQQCTPDRITVYTAASQPTWPAPRQGTYAARFNVYDSDVYPCTSTQNPRAQVLSKDFIKEGDEYWVAFSAYFPTNLPDVTPYDWVILQSFYGSPGGGSGPAHFALGWDGRLGKTVLSYAGTNLAIPLVRGQWLDLMAHVKFSKNPSLGWVEVYYNGVQQNLPACNCMRMVKQTINDETTSLLHSKLAFYRKAGMWPGAEAMYYDGHRVGRTRLDVESAPNALIASH